MKGEEHGQGSEGEAEAEENAVSVVQGESDASGSAGRNVSKSSASGKKVKTGGGGGKASKGAAGGAKPLGQKGARGKDGAAGKTGGKKHDLETTAEGSEESESSEESEDDDDSDEGTRSRASSGHDEKTTESRAAVTGWKQKGPTKKAAPPAPAKQAHAQQQAKKAGQGNLTDSKVSPRKTDGPPPPKGTSEAGSKGLQPPGRTVEASGVSERRALGGGRGADEGAGRRARDAVAISGKRRRIFAWGKSERSSCTLLSSWRPRARPCASLSSCII